MNSFDWFPKNVYCNLQRVLFCIILFDWFESSYLYLIDLNHFIEWCNIILYHPIWNIFLPEKYVPTLLDAALNLIKLVKCYSSYSVDLCGYLWIYLESGYILFLTRTYFLNEHTYLYNLPLPIYIKNIYYIT